MISVIIPTRNDETALAHALAALVPAAADGIVREVIVVDGGSTDGTALVADAAGCRFVAGSGDIGKDLAAAAAGARSDWLLFLSPQVALEPAWQREAHDFIDRVQMSGETERAAAFRHARADFGFAPRFSEVMASVRARLFTAPYLDQGLLLTTRLYRDVGGHRALPGMVDVDLARRIGRRRLSFLRARAVLRGDGRTRQRAAALRNSACLALFVLRVPPRLIGRLAA
ncbi:glycosyltransferase [Mesorhizobium sp. BR1-1-16]|uniref:glycosyltransferase n=1 Tax=Mesorhizobium sp. BR1-1-16 TaxID=2876653 RepID=UPI001CCD7449|nr:glycosyltransferase [Mesorhizobium sp. BR1-1-16]MBZ9934837.1 glycosyltransferase [Mesorhizobium sp. BR1-1-16]